MTLNKTTNGWSNGNLTIICQSYMPRTKFRWMAVWTDLFSVRHEVREYTRERLVDQLAPYGMGVIKFKRR